MHPPRLETDRLILQPLKEKDAGILFAYHAHPEVARFQSWHVKNASDALHFIKGHEGFDFGVPDTWYQVGIYLKSTPELVGDIGVHFLHENPKAVEIGYTIAPEHQRNGYAFEAVSKLLEFLFAEYGASTVIAVTDHQNQPSMGLLARLDFRTNNGGIIAFSN